MKRILVAILCLTQWALAAPAVTPQSILKDLGETVPAKGYILAYSAKVDDHRPTKAEVETFLRNSRWEWSATSGFRLEKSEVDPKAWKEGLGYPPNHGFRR